MEGLVLGEFLLNLVQTMTLERVSKRLIQSQAPLYKQSEALASLLISKQTEPLQSFISKYGSITDVNHAYQIQNGMSSILESEHGYTRKGWKIGCTAPNIQAMFGINEPFIGPFYDLWTEPNSAKQKDITVGVEAEWVFKIGETLNIENKNNIELSDIYPLIECVYPGYELIELRMVHETDVFKTPIQYLISDMAWTGGVVIGDKMDCKDLGCESWMKYDTDKLREARVTAYVDGKEVGVGEGKQILGSPFNSILFLYNKLLAEGRTVQEGELISTGTATGLNVMEKGQTARSVFSDIGEVQFKFV